MKQTLSIIQALAKAAKIICQVVFILTIIGGVSSLLSLGGLMIAQIINGETFLKILSMTEETINVETINVETMYFSLATALVACVSTCVMAKLTQKYLENELDAGTPFTVDGANELFRLGIIQLIVSAATSILVGTAFVVLSIFFPNLQEVEFDIDLTAGIIMIVMSLIFKGAAQSIEAKDLTRGEQSSEPMEEEKKKMEDQDNQEFFQ